VCVQRAFASKIRDDVMKLKSSRMQRAVVARIDGFSRAAVISTLAATMTIAASGSGFASGDAVRGESLYRICMACHPSDKNGIGPMHDGVFGSNAGSVVGYDYSAALKNSGIVWDSESLDAWLADPQALVPRNRMSYRIGNPQDRADVIEFLKIKFAR
jgi:cytochrome c